MSDSSLRAFPVRGSCHVEAHQLRGTSLVVTAEEEGACIPLWPGNKEIQKKRNQAIKKHNKQRRKERTTCTTNTRRTNERDDKLRIDSEIFNNKRDEESSNECRMKERQKERTSKPHYDILRPSDRQTDRPTD